MSKPTKICSVEGCKKRFYAHGFCRRHYDSVRRHGDAEPRRYDDPNEAFSARTEQQDDCLVWTGYRNTRGYGRLRANGKLVYAHRYAWERDNGPVPAGMMVDHICHNPSCVEVTHLRLASQAENMRNLSGARSDSRMGVRNVRKLPNGNYHIQICKDGTKRSFGTYATLEEAKSVAERERKRLFGDFAGAA